MLLQVVDKVVEVPQIHEVQRFVPRVEIQEVVRHVPKYHIQKVEKFVEVPQIQVVEKIVEVPQIHEVIKYQVRCQPFNCRSFETIFTFGVQCSRRLGERKPRVLLCLYYFPLVSLLALLIPPFSRSATFLSFFPQEKIQIVDVPVERIREVPKIEIKVVEKIRHVPGPIEYIDVPQETIREKPVIEIVENIIEEPELQVSCSSGLSPQPRDVPLPLSFLWSCFCC